MRIFTILLAFFLSPVSTEAQNKSTKSSGIHAVTFCELIHNPARFDGKQVRFRAKYISTFEVAAISSPDCPVMDKQTWVEFDRASIRASAKPKIYKKVEEQIFCCMYVGYDYTRITEILVTGIFHGSGIGYGHLGEYRFQITVKNIEKIGATEKIKVPGFDQH